MDRHAAPAATPHPPGAGTAGPPRRRRRWWVYGLWTLAGLFVLGVIAFVSAILYWNHLIRTYTSTEPAVLPKVEASDERFDELRERWEAYALLFLRPNERVPFELTDAELNLLLARMGPMRQRAYVEVREDQVRVRFSVPLGEGGDQRLQGRFLNGEGAVKVDLKDGRVSARLLNLKANGKAVPGWIFRRLQRVNWVDRMNWRPETDLVVRGLERIETRAGILVLHPRPLAAAAQ